MSEVISPGGRRLSDVVKTIGTVLGILIASGTLIWGASSISNSVTNLSVVVTDLKSTVFNLNNTIINILVEQARLRAEVEALKERERAK